MAQDAIVVPGAGVGVATEGGKLAPWGVADLPAPPAYSIKNAIRIAGAGAIILGGAIGSGEWLIGPAVTAQFTASLLWVATLSILLQWVFNEECCRYTLYTGEPIISGMMRTQPGPRFWGWTYSILGFLQLGWPGWAAAGTISPPQGRTPVDQVLGVGLPSAAGWSAHPGGVAARERRRHKLSITSAADAGQGRNS